MASLRHEFRPILQTISQESQDFCFEIETFLTSCLSQPTGMTSAGRLLLHLLDMRIRERFSQESVLLLPRPLLQTTLQLKSMELEKQVLGK